MPGKSITSNGYFDVIRNEHVLICATTWTE